MKIHSVAFTEAHKQTAPLKAATTHTSLPPLGAPTGFNKDCTERKSPSLQVTIGSLISV